MFFAQLKQFLKVRFPSIYNMARAVKDYLLPPQRWGNYYDGKDEILHRPESALLTLIPSVPAHIDTVLNIGCGSGRDFIPFNKKKRLWGIDIVPTERISWVENFTDLTYEHMNVEALTQRLKSEKPSLSNTLVYSCAVLMYVSGSDQRHFFDACRECGCRNFIFIEYPPDSNIYPETNFKLPLNQFDSLVYKPLGDTVAYFLLEKMPK